MNGDAASAAELGLSQAAAAEIVEEGVPAEVEDAAPRHGVISLTGPLAPAGNHRAVHAAFQMQFTGRTRFKMVKPTRINSLATIDKTCTGDEAGSRYGPRA